MGLRSEEDKLFKACRQGRVKVVQEIISLSMSTAENLVNTMSNDHKTPLYHAILAGSYQVVRLLIKHGADVNKLSAVFYGKDCSYPSFETCYEPPVVTSSRIGNTEILRCLLRNGGDPNGQADIASSHLVDIRNPLESFSPSSPLHKYPDKPSKSGKCLPYSMESSNSRLHNTFNGHLGMSALHSACESCQLENVRLLLSYGANANIEEGRRLEKPLHLASRCQPELCERQCDIIDQLCQHEADVSALNKRRHSPFYLAALYGCAKKVEILLKHGVNPNSHLVEMSCQEPGEWGGYGSAMHVAAYKDFLSLAVVLINCGADINSTNSTGMTPLHLNIVVRNRSNVAALLIFHGAFLNDKSQFKTNRHQPCASFRSSLYSNEGTTLLSKCLSSPRLDCESLAILLVQAGYNLNQDPWLIPELDMNHASERFSSAEPNPIRIRSAVTSPAGCRVSRLCKWLRVKQQTVRSLGEICRAFIRVHLAKCGDGRSIVPGVNKLPLPNALKNFVLLKSPSGKNIEEAILNCFRELQ